METLNQVLKVLFQEVRSEDVIDRILLKTSKYSDFESQTTKFLLNLPQNQFFRIDQKNEKKHFVEQSFSRLSTTFRRKGI